MFCLCVLANICVGIVWAATKQDNVIPNLTKRLKVRDHFPCFRARKSTGESGTLQSLLENKKKADQNLLTTNRCIQKKKHQL